MCPRTHESRTKRHDSLLDLTASLCKKKGWTYSREPAIPTTAGIRRPDFLMKVDDKVHVIDAQVVSDNALLSESHGRKVQYYKNREIEDYAKRVFNVETVEFSSITLNWRGAIAQETADWWTRVGFSKADMELLVVRTLEGGAKCVRHFRRSTYTLR